MLTGLIMSGDTPVARFSGRAVTPMTAIGRIAAF